MRCKWFSRRPSCVGIALVSNCFGVGNRLGQGGRGNFERTATISEKDASRAKCPKCGSKNVPYIPGDVFVVTSKKS